MSRALCVFHGRFGRASVYQLNRPFNVHAHREGHLIFHIGGTPGSVDVLDRPQVLDEDSVIAINPWEPHNFRPNDTGEGALFFVLYVNSDWFGPSPTSEQGVRFGRTRFPRSASLDKRVKEAASMVCGAPSLSDLDNELRSLIDACFEESWSAPRVSTEPHPAVTDFRVRKSIKLLSQGVKSEIELDDIAREAGLSRPHFYKLFRSQTGVTPNIYLNTLVMEQALEMLVSSDVAIADIGYDLGFTSQSGFTRFFSGNVGMAPSDYRRAAKVLRA